ncbi:hypothetical protein [Desulfurobacterium crinifex]
MDILVFCTGLGIFALIYFIFTFNLSSESIATFAQRERLILSIFEEESRYLFPILKESFNRVKEALLLSSELNRNIKPDVSFIRQVLDNPGLVLLYLKPLWNYMIANYLLALALIAGVSLKLLNLSWIILFPLAIPGVFFVYSFFVNTVRFISTYLDVPEINPLRIFRNPTLRKIFHLNLILRFNNVPASLYHHNRKDGLYGHSKAVAEKTVELMLNSGIEDKEKLLKGYLLGLAHDLGKLRYTKWIWKKVDGSPAPDAISGKMKTTVKQAFPLPFGKILWLSYEKPFSISSIRFGIKDKMFAYDFWKKLDVPQESNNRIVKAFLGIKEEPEIAEFVKKADSIVTGEEMRHLGKLYQEEIREAFFSALSEIRWHGREAEKYEGWFNGDIAVVLSWALADRIDKVLKEKGIEIVDNSYSSKMKVHSMNYLIAEALEGILIEEWNGIKADDLKLFDAVIGKARFNAVFVFRPENLELPVSPMRIKLLQR